MLEIYKNTNFKFFEIFVLNFRVAKMKIEISLMALLSVATISALSLEGYKCSDHAILTGDTVAPIRTVRICGVKDYVGAPSYANYQSSDPGVEKRGKKIL